ncbi:hypothetical protein PIB30_094346 [Stylosanthes scabra]|uniref:Uncharacterized protein n=1 Tax=Stylosanthes scabra TaxID=79078 RepID=A0ABU6TV02_9FABA|nr:hypothetical protein [Stylosanthes scabra]
MDADDQAPPAAEDPEPRRGRRAVRRRGCGMGGHEKQVENMKNMESGNFASGASKAPRICVGITQEPTHMRGIDMTSHAYTSSLAPRRGILDDTGGLGMASAPNPPRLGVSSSALGQTTHA